VLNFVFMLPQYKDHPCCATTRSARCMYSETTGSDIPNVCV